MVHPTEIQKVRSHIGDALTLAGEAICHLDYTPKEQSQEAMEKAARCYGRAISFLAEAMRLMLLDAPKTPMFPSSPPDVKVEYLYMVKASRCPNSSRKTPTMYYACINILGHKVCTHIPWAAYSMLRDRGVKIEKAKKR